jgi:hypothetical protein
MMVILRTQKNDGRIFDVQAEEPSAVAQGFNPGARAQIHRGRLEAALTDQSKKASRIPGEDGVSGASGFPKVRYVHVLQIFSYRAIIPRNLKAKQDLPPGFASDRRLSTRRSGA